MVVQVVRLAIKPEQRDRWLELVPVNGAQTRAEDGCEGYQVSEDIETPNAFVEVIRWSSLEAQYNHFRNPDFGELLGKLSDVLAGPPEVSIYEVSSAQTLDEALAAAGVSR